MTNLQRYMIDKLTILLDAMPEELTYYVTLEGEHYEVQAWDVKSWIRDISEGHPLPEFSYSTMMKVCNSIWLRIKYL